MSDTPEVFIGFTESTLVTCNITGKESFTAPVLGRYFNSNESPIILTPEGARLKDDQPQTTDLEIDLTSLGIPKGSVFVRLKLTPNKAPSSIKPNSHHNESNREQIKHNPDYKMTFEEEKQKAHDDANRETLNLNWDDLKWETIKYHPDYEITTVYPFYIRDKRDGEFNHGIHFFNGEHSIIMFNGVKCSEPRIIAEQFIPNPNNYNRVEYIKFQGLDQLWNLRWFPDADYPDSWIEYEDFPLFNMDVWL